MAGCVIWRVCGEIRARRRGCNVRRLGAQRNYYADLETELYLLGGGGGGRYYDPATGRFTSEDPVPQVNLYPYAENDPVNRVDPSGLVGERHPDEVRLDELRRQIAETERKIAEGERKGRIINWFRVRSWRQQLAQMHREAAPLRIASMRRLIAQTSPVESEPIGIPDKPLIFLPGARHGLTVEEYLLENAHSIRQLAQNLDQPSVRAMSSAQVARFNDPNWRRLDELDTVLERKGFWTEYERREHRQLSILVRYDDSWGWSGFTGLMAHTTLEVGQDLGHGLAGRGRGAGARPMAMSASQPPRQGQPIRMQPVQPLTGPAAAAGPRVGTLTFDLRGAGQITPLEINAAQVMAWRGYNVVLRTPVGTRHAGGTSDLLLNGVRAEIYAPTTVSPGRIIGGILRKNSQLPGGGSVVLDLRRTTVRRSDLGDIMYRLQRAAETQGVPLNVREVHVIEW